MAQSVRGNLPYLEGSASGARPQIERAVGKWLPGVSRKHKGPLPERDDPSLPQTNFCAAFVSASKPASLRFTSIPITPGHETSAETYLERRH